MRRFQQNASRPHAIKPIAQRPMLLTNESLPSLPRQARSVKARARLKTAALDSFAEKGFEETSVAAIARRAKVATGGFYQHFRSKRQLLLVLMDELLAGLSGFDLNMDARKPIRLALRDLLSRAFSRDLRFMGAYRAWQEAMLTDAELAAMDRQIHDWTTARVRNVLDSLQQLPGARRRIRIDDLAKSVDTFFWALLAQAAHKHPETALVGRVESATHLIYHAMFRDSLKRDGQKRGANT